MYKPLLVLSCGTVALTCATAIAGTFSSDFSNPNQPGMTLTSNNANRPDGTPFQPVIADGHLILTYNENSEQGSERLILVEQGPHSGTALKVGHSTARLRRALRRSRVMVLLILDSISKDTPCIRRWNVPPAWNHRFSPTK